MSLIGLGDLVVEREQQALAGVLADPALGDREVDHVRRVAGVERVVQVVLERGLVVLPVDLDARVGRLEPGDRVLDPVVERRRQVERPEADLGVRLDARDHRLGGIGGEGLGARARGRRALGRRGALGRGAGGGAAVGAGAWLAGDGVALVLVQAPTAKTVASPRARNLRDFIVRCSSLAIVSANLHARDRRGDPAGGPGTRGVSCDHLLQVHGRAARRGPGPRLATRSPPPFP